MKTQASYRKHEQVEHTLALRLKAIVKRLNPARILLIDGNAGDGNGVRVPGYLLPSSTTARLLIEQALKYRDRGIVVDVILCEINSRTRKALEYDLQRWCSRLDGLVQIIGDHKYVLEHIRHDYDYVLWLSDPTGYSRHGEFSSNDKHPFNPEASPMYRLRHMVRHCDFLILFNETSLTRTKSEGKSHGKPRSDVALAAYDKARVRRIMLQKSYFADVLKLPYLARQVNIQKQSPSFGFRMLLVSTEPVGHHVRSWNAFDKHQRQHNHYPGASREMERIDRNAETTDVVATG